MKHKFFFFDIDGTLTDGKSFEGGIPHSAIDAIAQLKDNGHIVGIATGRPYSTAKVFAATVGIENIVCNGGYACYMEGKCIENIGLSMYDCQHVIQECLDKQLPFCVSLEEDFTFLTHDTAFGKAVDQKEFHATLTIDEDIEYAAIENIYRIIIALKPGEENLITRYGTLVASRYHDSFVIIEPDDKYHGILCMLQSLQKSEEAVVVFGDGSNDIKMFERAPFSIAMGNGIEQIKEIANFVTKRSDEDGLAYALRYFGWI